MARFYFDSSALAKRYLEEPGTRRVLQLIESVRRAVVSQLAWVEVASAAARHAREGMISGELFEKAICALEYDFRNVFDVVKLENAVIVRSVDVVRVHGLRAADAIQLACALLAASDSRGQSEFTFVCTDAELSAAATTEGLAVLDPTDAL